jgi:hypothetical protein
LFVPLSVNTVPPSSPPRDIQLNVESSTSIDVSWKAPTLEDGLLVTGYQVCIAHVQSVEKCDVILRTKAFTCVVSGLKSASKYKVRVSAKNKVGYGKYSKDYIVLTNAGKKYSMDAFHKVLSHLLKDWLSKIFLKNVFPFFSTASNFSF